MVALWLPLLLALPTPVPDFELRDHRGAVRRLSDWRENTLVVVAFLGTECPLAQLYAPRLKELAQVYGSRGVAFVGINANQNDSVTAISHYAAEHQLPFPILKDVGNTVADRFGAERTPEVFVLDERRVIRYRGRIDDQYGVGVHRPAATRADLAIALDKLLAGKPVGIARTEAAGCRIGRVPRAAQQGPVTYCRDVAPILQKHCVGCHRPGEIAPFSLTTYQQAAGWAPMMREVLEEGRMPPWHANPRYGHFANDSRLPDAEKQRLFAWIDGGCPEGNPADLPPAPTFTEGWSIPKPDVVLTMAQPFTVPASGTIEYQFFELDPGFTEDKWVRAAEVRPGNRVVVHHCTVFLKPPDAKEPTEAGTLGSYCLAATAPGTPPLLLPDGMAKRIPAGWHLLFVIHYTPVGTVQQDQTSIGLVLAEPSQVKQEVATKIMMDLDFAIPPHTADYELAQTWQVNEDVLLLSFFPHMHLRGKAFRYEAIYPDGTTEILLDVPHYDFNWQNRYVLAEPKRLPGGTQLRCTAHYDNSAGNLSNPDPSATVHAGLQSWDEMFNGYFEVVRPEEDLTRPVPPREALWTTAQGVSQSVLTYGVLGSWGGFLVLRRVARRAKRPNAH